MKRIGVLVDDLKMRSWQKRISQHILDHNELDLSVLIINKNESVTSNTGIIYRLFQAVDRKMFKVSNDALKNTKYDYGIQFNEIITLSPTEFEEIRLEQIPPNWKKNLVATHTFNSVEGFTVLNSQGIINKKF